MTQLGVGLIGFGLGGATFHAPFITRTAGLALTSIVTTNAERAQAARCEYPDARILADVDALLATRPDVVVISTPNATHVPLARRALEAGAHVVVDKPFAATSEDARGIQELAQRVGRLAIPFQNRRWDGDFLTLQSLIASGRFGDVFRFESRFDRWRPVKKAVWTHPDAEANGDSVLHDLHTHLIDQALQLFGPVTHVYAEVRAVDPAVTVSDDALLALTHTSGVQSHLVSSMTAAIPGPRFQVFGTRGAYVKFGVDVQEAALRSGIRPDHDGYGEEQESDWGTFSDGAASERVPTVRGDYSPFYRGVARAILENEKPPVTISEVTQGLEIIEAAFASARMKSVVSLNQ
jgi:scyllo-inositol 2-dehydrogenase (NADP+)